MKCKRCSSIVWHQILCYKVICHSRVQQKGMTCISQLSQYLQSMKPVRLYSPLLEGIHEQLPFLHEPATRGFLIITREVANQLKWTETNSNWCWIVVGGKKTLELSIELTNSTHCDADYGNRVLSPKHKPWLPVDFAIC